MEKIDFVFKFKNACTIIEKLQNMQKCVKQNFILEHSL